MIVVSVVSLSFSSWPRPRLRPRLVTPNLMTSLGTWKKVSTWAALKWIVQGKLQCLTHTGGSIVTISALSREIREKIKGHVRQPPVNVQNQKKTMGWKRLKTPNPTRAELNWSKVCTEWAMTLVCAARKRDKKRCKIRRECWESERTHYRSILDLGMEHKMDSLRIC